MKLLAQIGRPVTQLKVGVLGLTFKENVPDLRNSKVPDIINELREYGVEVLVHDPLADPKEAVEEYGIHLAAWEQMHNLDGIVVAVAHQHYTDMKPANLLALLRADTNGVLIDVKSILHRDEIPDTIKYWRL